MKVYFSGFWGGFLERTDSLHVEFFIKLLKDVYNEDIIVSNNIDDADILFNSVFTPDQSDYFLNYKKWKATFLYTGEAYHNVNYLSSYTCILGYKSTNDNYIELPLYVPYMISYENMSFEPCNCIKNNHVSAVIGNHSAQDRRLFLDKLEKNMIIRYGGSYKNNIGGRLQGLWSGDNLINFYKNSKFVITMENTKIEHYITEKLINGFRAGIVPIYWGSPYISKHFNTKRFILLEDASESSIDAVIDKMINMSDEEYFRMVNEPIFNEGMNIDIVYNIAVNNIKKLVFKNKN